jgi:hypothetical protein
MTEPATTQPIPDVHPASAAMLQWFEHDHLPEHLQKIVEPIMKLAEELVVLGAGPEMTVGLRKLLEAKDCFVRAAIELEKIKKAKETSS